MGTLPEQAVLLLCGGFVVAAARSRRALAEG